MKAIRKGTVYNVTVEGTWCGSTIEIILTKKWLLPKKLVHSWRMEKSVLINGAAANWHAPLRQGDQIAFPFFAPKPFGADPKYADVSVLYEDDHMLIADKPAGLKTHPNESHENNTLLNYVCYHISAAGDQLPVRHVHRLDEGTSGAVLFSKHEAAYGVFSRLLEEKEIFRTYYAVVDGEVKQKSGTINKPIGKDRHHPTRRRLSPQGQIAVTHFRRIAVENGLSLLECRLETGRTHQIRVHLASIGHPITGDTLYGGSPRTSRSLLHAKALTVPHVFLCEEITVSAPVPSEITKLFSALQ